MNDYEIVLSKFISASELLKSLANGEYLVQLGGNDDQIYLISKETNKTLAIIWTIELNADGKPNNNDEAQKEWNSYKLTPPCTPFFSYLIEWSDDKVLEFVIRIFKTNDCKVFLLDDKMKKFVKI